MHIQDLMIELTRSCNMVCTHCIRGQAQKVVISIDTIQELVEKLNITEVGSLMFTGGEPSMYPELIMETMELFKRRDISYQSFFIATNAIRHNKSNDFFIALANLYANAEDKDMCSVRISRDDYHVLSTQTIDDEILSVLSFVEIDDLESYELYNEGFAFDNGLSNSTKFFELENVELNVYFEEDTGFNCEINEPLYLASNGNLGLGCDFSYERFDKVLSFANISDVADEGDFISKLLIHSFKNDVEIYLDEDVIDHTNDDFKEFHSNQQALLSA